MRKLLPALLALALVGCASFQPGRYERSADRIIGLINSGQAAELASASGAPFLLDGEILVRRADVADFWKDAARAGLKIGPQAAARAVPLDNRTFERFAQTMEVRAFFSKYISDRGSLVVVEAGKTRILLLFERGKWGRTLIVGFKGPDAL
jgi:hypothetical protein